MLIDDKDFIVRNLAPANYDTKVLDTYYCNFACPVCKQPVIIDFENDILDAKPMFCDNGCVIPSGLGYDYEYFNIHTALMYLSPQYVDLVENLEMFRYMSWYHISDTPPEYMDFASEKTMHIGGADTVCEYFLQHRNWIIGEQDFYIYKLHIKPEAIIYPTVIEDENDWDYAESAIAYLDDYNTIAYLNRWESPGSISLILRRDMVELVEYQRNALPIRKD